MNEATPDSVQTSELLLQAQQGNRAAFEKLFTQYRAYVHRVIELRLDPKLRARIDISDVVQDTQLEAFRRLADYLKRRPMPFRLWLHRTAAEQLVMLQRRHLGTARRSLAREAPFPEGSALVLAQQLLAAGSTPSQHLNKEELATRVRQALAQLSEIDQEVLLLRTYEGLSYEEIASLLELEPAAARKRHGRALLRLHQLLSDTGLTESQL